VPNPVTGSQPGAVEKPLVPQPELVPSVMSLKASGFWYKIGFKNPRGPDLPAAIRSSMIRLIMEAKMGAEAEVPPLRVLSPLTTTAMLSPLAETSGYPRPDRL
jgi:hypothetical protein